MFVELAEISRLKGTNSIYLLVHFWRSQADADAGQPPLLTNDFIMQLRRTGERVVTDANGNMKRLDGVFVAPEDVTPEDEAIGWEREAFTRTRSEIFAEVRANVVAYVRRAVAAKRTGDHTGDPSKPLFEDGRLIVQRVSQVFERDDVNDSAGVLQQLRTFRGRREEVGE